MANHRGFNKATDDFSDLEKGRERMRVEGEVGGVGGRPGGIDSNYYALAK